MDELDDLVAAAAAADLVTPVGREWIVTGAGDAWLEATTTTRWAIIAEGLRARCPPGLRTADGGFRPLSSWAGAYPLARRVDRARARACAASPKRGACITADGTEPPWTTSLRSGGAPDTEGLAAHLPAEIDRVYLQADLTAIAPGPLAPALDLRLRTIATRESRAQASTYRFTADSLGAGMTEGETAESIREFLRGTLADRHPAAAGLPRREHRRPARSRPRARRRRRRGARASRATTSRCCDTIAVDQALRPLGLVRDGDELARRGSTATRVYWSLADARYPVVALDADGAPRVAATAAPAPPIAGPVDAARHATRG